MCKHVCSQKHYLQRLTTLRAVVHTHTHTHIHAHIHTHTHAHTHRLTHSHTHAHTHTHQTSSRSLGRCKHGPRRTSQTTQIQTYHCRSQRHMALCAVHNSYLLKGVCVNVTHETWYSAQVFHPYNHDTPATRHKHTHMPLQIAIVHAILTHQRQDTRTHANTPLHIAATNDTSNSAQFLHQ